MSGFVWAPRKLLSQTPHLAWCCSAAPQTAAWTGWPEVLASVALQWISGGEEREWGGPFCTFIMNAYDWRGFYLLFRSSTAEQSSLCSRTRGYSVSNTVATVSVLNIFNVSFAITLICSATFFLSHVQVTWEIRLLLNDFRKTKTLFCMCNFPYHNSKLLWLCHVVVFLLHLTQYTQLFRCRQLFDQILSGNKQ